MTTTAKYQTKCHECGLSIRPGDAIEPGYRSFRHTDCTMASVYRQTEEQIASGATHDAIWAWINRSAHLTWDQKIEALMFAKTAR